MQLHMGCLLPSLSVLLVGGVGGQHFGILIPTYVHLEGLCSTTVRGRAEHWEEYACHQVVNPTIIETVVKKMVVDKR